MKKITIEWYLIGFGIFILLPFLILCFYNHPVTDDYGYTNIANKYGFWGAQEYWYSHWAGCLLPSIQMSINPLLFQWFFGFKIIPFIYFFVFILALYFLIHTLTGTDLAYYQKWAIVFSITTIYLYYLPLTSHGLFWLTGLATYQTPTILTLLLLALLFKIKSGSKQSYLLIGLAVFLILLIIQASETYVVLILGLLSLLLFIAIITYKKIDRLFTFLVIIGVIAALSVFLAPGMHNRAGTYPATNDLGSHFNISFTYILVEILGFMYYKSLLLVLLSIILLPVLDTFLLKFKDKKEFTLTLINPLLAFSFTLCFSALIIAPFCWLNQSYPVGRVANMAYFYFVLGNMYTILCFWNYIRSKYKIDFEGKFYKRSQRLFFVLAILMLLLPNNIRAAYADLFLGRASLYSAQLNKRYKTIAECKSDTCVVPPLDIYPVTISYADITTNPGSWENQITSTFYHKKAIFLSSPKVKKKELNF